MQATLKVKEKELPPTFTTEQLDYLTKIFTHPINPDVTYSLERINYLQGEVNVVQHIKYLISRQQKG